jgi:ABC-2 type transport system permease protein
MNAATETTETFVAPAPARQDVRPFYWSVRRELWENRSLLIAPLVPGAIALLALIYVALMGSHDVRALAELPAQLQGQGATFAFGAIAYATSIVMNIAVFFYLIDALQTERKDRSVLFWKSMPVSDTTTVLSKLFTALVVTGAIVLIVATVTMLGMLLLGSVVLLFSGVNPAAIWSHSQLVETILGLAYWQLALAFWYAPVAAWLLLVSAWAKRATILWALLTPIALMVFERVAIRTRYIEGVLSDRLKDPVIAAMAPRARDAQFTIGDEGVNVRGVPHRVFDLLDPLGFFANPWLWVGLLVAAGLIAAAIWMRRSREPI